MNATFTEIKIKMAKEDGILKKNKKYPKSGSA